MVCIWKKCRSARFNHVVSSQEAFRKCCASILKVSNVRGHDGLMSEQTTISPAASSPVAASSATGTVEIVIPVYNEAHTITPCITKLRQYLASFPRPATITIADNASTDGTLAIASELAATFPEVHVLHLDQKGRGRALKRAWLASTATVVCYMDVDLSTDLKALDPLLASLLSGRSDLAIGTRLSRNSHVVRGVKREFISRCYNQLLRSCMRAKFSDAQCGFKAMRADVAQKLLPYIADDAWFFDTELLVLAEKAGYRIMEVPVDWVDDPDSRVNIIDTALKDLTGMVRVRWELATGKIPFDLLSPPVRPQSSGGRIIKFLLVGVASTICYTALFLLFNAVLPSMQLANFLALLISALFNTVANRSYTFNVPRSRHRWTDHGLGLAVFAAGWLATSGALELAAAAGLLGSTTAKAVIVTAANVLVTVAKYVCLKLWFHQTEK